MNATDPGKAEQNLFLVVRIATSFSLAAMVAFLYSIKTVHPQLRFALSPGTWAAFVVTALATWFVLHFLFKRAGQKGSSRRERTLRLLAGVGISAVLIGGMILAFARGMANLPPGEVREMVEGTVMAFICLGALGVIFAIVIRFLQRDHRRTVEEEKRHASRE